MHVVWHTRVTCRHLGGTLAAKTKKKQQVNPGGLGSDLGQAVLQHLYALGEDAETPAEVEDGMAHLHSRLEELSQTEGAKEIVSLIVGWIRHHVQPHLRYCSHGYFAETPTFIKAPSTGPVTLTTSEHHLSTTQAPLLMMAHQPVASLRAGRNETEHMRAKYSKLLNTKISQLKKFLVERQRLDVVSVPRSVTCTHTCMHLC